MAPVTIVFDGDAPVVSIVALPIDEAHRLVGDHDYLALLRLAAHADAGAAWSVTASPGVVMLRGVSVDGVFAGIAGGTASLWRDAGLGIPSYAPERLAREAAAWIASLRHGAPLLPTGPVGRARAALARAIAGIVAPRLVGDGMSAAPPPS
jgi:hypothetical protein